MNTGQFVWHDLMSTDHKAATSFYQRLFEWDLEVVDMGKPIGNYTMFKSEDTTLGGVVPMDPSYGNPSHWISYISVADVDAACAKIKALGGDVPYDPFDIPNIGRTAVASDPTGAYFSPYKDNDEAYEPPAPRVGLFTWHELMSTDIEKAKPFYMEIMNWDLDSMDLEESGTYWMFNTKRHENDDRSPESRAVAGAIQMPAKAGKEAASNWLPYVAVSDVPKVASEAKALGGSIYVPPTKIEEPTNVHFSVLAGPDGSMFGIVEV